jgi:hypothetical protein
MKLKSLMTVCAAMLAAVLFSGCAAVVVGGAAGVGTYAYIKGELKVTENATLDRCWSATQGAMKDLQFSVTTQQKDSLSGHLVARTAMDKKIEVYVTKISENLTEVRVRVGTFGDEEMSRLVIQKIESRL